MIYLKRVNKLGCYISTIIISGLVGSKIGTELVFSLGCVVFIFFMMLKIEVEDIYLFNIKKNKKGVSR